MTTITGGLTLHGEGSGDNLGDSVSDAGDVNGDGIADVILGGRFGQPLGLPRAGSSHVAFGSVAFPVPVLDLPAPDGTNGFEIAGGVAGTQPGNSVSAAGDAIGDGHDDITVAALDDGYVAGPEFLVNTAAAGDQNRPAIAALPNGGFVVSWQTSDPSQDGDGMAVKAQVFDASGAILGGEIAVNAAGTGNQGATAVAALENGGFVVTWHTDDPAQDGSSWAIKAQIFDAAGAKQGSEFLVNTAAADLQGVPAITGLSNGSFVVSWVTFDPAEDGDGWAEKAQIFDASGAKVGGEFLVNTKTDGNQYAPAIAAIANGGFVATWHTDDANQDGDGWAVKAQLFDATGAKQGGELLVNTEAASDQYDPWVSGLANGGFAVMWHSRDPAQDGSGHSVKGQIFDAAGAKVGGEFLVNVPAVGDQDYPTLTGLPNGGFVATWYTWAPDDGSATAIKAQVFDETGGKLGTEFLVNTTADGIQGFPRVATLADGGFAIAWDTDDPAQDGSGYAIKARVFSTVDANHAPVAADLAVAVDEDTVITGMLVANDVDGDPLAYALAGAAANGTAVVNPDGSFSYTPAPDFNGPDSFTFAVDDGHGGSATGTVSLTIAAVNDPPVAQDDGISFLGMTFNGIDAQDFSGVSVSNAGDVNGDGFDDLIIGAQGADPGGRSTAGETYVVFGRATGLPATLALSSLNGANGFVINGVDAGDESGFAVSDAGDVNGDGFGDLIVGARLADPGGRTSAGESYVVFGHAGGFAPSLDLSSLNGLNGFTVNGVDPGDASGIWVSGAGDVNGDGFDDVIIGATSAGHDGLLYTGESYVVFGKATGFAPSLDLASLSGADGFALKGANAHDFSGYSVSGAGDVNGDGFDDVIVGAYSASPGGRSEAGQSYVVFGKASGFAPSFDLSALDGVNGFALNGIDAGDLSGVSVSDVGDVNGDGYGDVIVGALYADPGGRYNAGESYVVFGHAGGFAPSLDLSSLDGLNGFTINGVGYGGDSHSDQVGSVVSGAGDVNGDGFDDIFVTSRTANPGGRVDAGESYLIFGKESGFSASLELSSLNGTNGVVLIGVNRDDLAGASISGAGDVNGDGYDDLIIGANLADPGGRTSAGQSYVVFGGAARFAAADLADGTSDGRIELSLLSAPYGVIATDEDTATPIDVLANDSDAEGDPLTVAAVDTTGTIGAVAIAADGKSVLYDPGGRFDALKAGETVTDVFTYTAADGNGGFDTASVTMTVTGVNDAPVAADLAASGAEDTVITGHLAATDAEGDPLAYALAGAAMNGTAVVNPDGSFSYTPAPDFNGPDSFTFAVDDGHGGSATGTVSLTIAAVNDPPVAQDDAAIVLEDGVTLNLWDLMLANDSDVEGHALTIQGVDLTGTLGSVLFDESSRSLVFQADAAALDALASGETLQTSFGYTISDGHGGTASATVTMTVYGVPEPTGTTYTGGAGDDPIQGGSAAESLNGGAGDDLLNGGPGNDQLRGGEGADTFQFYPNCGRDTVLTFVRGTDVIDARGVLGVATHQEVFAFFDTNSDGLVTETDAHSYKLKGAIVLEFDGDAIDGNAADAAELKGISALDPANFDNLFGY